MKVDLRYNLQHIGDIFVETVQKTAATAIQCSRGAYLFYDINRLRLDKHCIFRHIGERVTLLVKERATDLANDVKLTEIFSRLSGIEKSIEEHEKERNGMVNPFRAK
jgi:hypothetical protein